MSKTSLNVGHDFLPGVSYPEYITEDVRLFKFKGINDFRMAISDHSNANAILYEKLYIKRMRELLPTSSIIWGVNKIGNKWKLSQWAALKAKHIEAAQYCQANNLIFQLFNEDDATWCRAADNVATATKVGADIFLTFAFKHGLTAGEVLTVSNLGALMTIPSSGEPMDEVIDDYTVRFTPAHPGTDGTVTTGTVMPSPSLVRNRYIACATNDIRPVYAGEIIGSVAQGCLTNWPTGGGDISIAFNIYGEGANFPARLANFKTQVDQYILMPQPVGAKRRITEYGIHASFGSYPPVYADQVSEIKQRTDYINTKPEIDNHYFFCWRSNSWSGAQNDDFAMRLTWSNAFAPLNIRWSDAI